MRTAGVADRDHEPLYREARLVCLDTVTGRIEPVLAWISEGPWDPEAVGHCFKGLRREGDELLLCTEREVLVAGLDGAVREVTSHPWFNDLHDAMRWGGRLYACSTGLDRVLVLEGDEVRRIHRFGPLPLEDRDYRAVSTKPHAVHPNHLFTWEGSAWVTRFHPEDAVCLDEPGRRVRVGGPPHDGLPWGDRLWFTTVDGRLVEVEPRTGGGRVHRIAGRRPLGWCRGLWIEGDVAFVGFSRLRATTARRHLARLRGWWRGGRFDAREPTRVIAHRISTGETIASWDLEAMGVHAVFALAPGDDAPEIGVATGSGSRHGEGLR